MRQINDAEFGEITVRVIPKSSRISIRVAPNGSLRVSAPKFTPKIAIVSLINSSRSDIRKMISEQRTLYDTSQPIGKSHSLVVQIKPTTSSVTTTGTTIFVSTPDESELVSAKFQQEIREHIVKALRKEAKSYLPRRLKYLAEKYDFSYSSTKLTHASSRWGSCSSTGTISMNISLMKLPFELIDYVLIHELSHTKFMNHSDDFWQLVKTYEPNYIKYRRELKNHSPNL